MQRIVTAGIVLGIAVALWSVVFLAAGWYKEAKLSPLFVVGAIAIQIGALVWGLMGTAREGRRYGGQVLAGLMISLVGGLIILVCSLVMTPALAPDYAEQTAAMQAEAWAEAGISEQQIEQMLEGTAFMRTPLGGAIFGFIATLITGLVITLIAAAFLRDRGPRTSSI